MTENQKYIGYQSLALVLSIVLVVTVLTYCSACSRLNDRLGLPDDNPIEESIEESLDSLVENKLGYNPNIDLTPDLDEGSSN